MPTEFEVVDTGIVYRNPKPHLRSIVAYHPSLVLLSDLECLATFDMGEAVESLDYHTVATRSRDGGKTWHLEGALVQRPPAGTTHTVRTSRLADGSLVGFGAYFLRNNSEEGLINRTTSGFVPTSLFLVRSSDAGGFWAVPQRVETPLQSTAWELCHPVLELRGGRWLAPISTWRDWSGENRSGEQTVALLSDDRGRSWPNYGVIFDGRQTGKSHLEVSVVELNDGRILAVAWVYDMANGRTFPNEYTLSDRYAQTFSPPKLTGFHAQTCKVLPLRDGKLFCAFLDSSRPGLWGRLARLDGNEWENVCEAPLWLGAETGMQGRRSSAEELAALKFGYPSMKQLATGEVLLLFWCQEQCVTNIRWLRIRIG
jgi:sialidase-1